MRLKYRSESLSTISLYATRALDNCCPAAQPYTVEDKMEYTVKWNIPSKYIVEYTVKASVVVCVIHHVSNSPMRARINHGA